MTTQIYVTNSANIVVGQTGVDTLGNLESLVATWNAIAEAEDEDDEAVEPSSVAVIDNEVIVTLSAKPPLRERVGFVLEKLPDEELDDATPIIVTADGAFTAHYLAETVGKLSLTGLWKREDGPDPVSLYDKLLEWSVLGYTTLASWEDLICWWDE